MFQTTQHKLAETLLNNRINGHVGKYTIIRKVAFVKESHLSQSYMSSLKKSESPGARQGQFHVVPIYFLKGIYPRSTAWLPGMLLSPSVLLTSIALLYRSAVSTLHSA